jgi:hypothetical protein
VDNNNEQAKVRKKERRVYVLNLRHIGGTFAFGSHPETWVQICSALIIEVSFFSQNLLMLIIKIDNPK